MNLQSKQPDGNSADSRILSWIEKGHGDSPEEICSWSDPKPKSDTYDMNWVDPKPKSDSYDMNWVDPDPDPEPASLKYEVLPIIAIAVIAAIAVAIIAVCITTFHLPSFASTLLFGPQLA